MNNQKEIFVPIEGYEGLCEVSNQGRIKSLIRYRKRKVTIIKQYLNPQGYLVVCLSHFSDPKWIRVHRVIAQAFIPNPENKPFINHKNGLRHDNRIENLEWCTARENVVHSFEVLKREHKKGPKITPLLYRIVELSKSGLRPFEIVRATGLNKSTVFRNLEKSYLIIDSFTKDENEEVDQIIERRAS